MSSASPACNLGALPARFRRARVLIVGCGDVGLRVAQVMRASATGRSPVCVLALTSSPERAPALRAQGITPLLGNLDHAASLRRLSGLATHVLHLAPPPGQGERDPRTQALVRALRLRCPPAALVYASTSGVYGDCGGAWVTETRAVAPTTARARRRVDAERLVRFAGRSGLRASILRVPGIYAPNREGGTPEARLRRGTPVLVPADDVYTNHIHADDLARLLALALFRGRPGRAYNACDDSQLAMGDYFDLVADACGLPRPPRLSRAELAQQVSPMTLSFMSESRRIGNARIKNELRARLLYPTVADALRARGGPVS